VSQDGQGQNAVRMSMSVTGMTPLVNSLTPYASMCQAVFVVSVNLGFTITLVFVLVRVLFIK